MMNTTDQIARAMAMDAKATADSKADLVGGKVPASQLPSYVDDVVEYSSVSAFPVTGESGKIYVATDTNTSYRWSGSTYIPITGQSDWNQTDNTAPDYIKNKPTLGTASALNVAASGNASTTEVVKGDDSRLTDARTPLPHTHTVSQITDFPTLANVATSGDYDDLLNKPTIPAAQVNADWNAVSGVAQILNKPTIPDAQIQSDWNQSDSTAKDYIKNKPTIPAAVTVDQVYDGTSANPQSGIAINSVIGNINTVLEEVL